MLATNNFTYYVKNSILMGRPYVQVPFTCGRNAILEAIDAFFDFLNLPETTKKHIDLKISSNHRRGEIGYWERKSEDDKYNDDKSFFHFHPLIFNKYRGFIKTNHTVERFLNLALPIWLETYNVVYSILREFEEDYPGTIAKVFATTEPHIILRFLKYDFTNSGEYLAKPHFDSGSFTLAIAESHPGLRISSSPQDLLMIKHEEDKALFMVSSNCHKIIANNKLTPAWHDVIQADRTQIGKSFARWAIVAFIDGHSVESLSRIETHKF